MDQFAVLADPVRRQVVELLADGPVTAGEIAARFPITRPAVSRHLRVLRECGLARSRVSGQRRVYTLHRPALVEMDRWLDRFRPLTASSVTAGSVTAGSETTDATAPPTGPATRLDALDTELRRGRRRAAPAAGGTPGENSA